MSTATANPPPAIETPWQPLTLIRRQFIANCEALAARDPELADTLRSHAPPCEYLLHAGDDTLRIARRVAGGVEMLPNRVPPQSAKYVVAKVFPGGVYNQATLVAGVDQGWLWHALYKLPAAAAEYPGHRPPLYLLCADVEELFVALHLQDCRPMLGDARVSIFAGPDAVGQLRRRMLGDLYAPWPRMALTIDPAVWCDGTDLDAVRAAAGAELSEQLGNLRTTLEAAYAGHSADVVARRLSGGERLRVMGITSRHTTFLQHSMRDWLAAFAAMGHETRLVIEHADHELLTNLVYARACDEFRPDLVLIIDHCRAQMDGIPAAVPCVMWVQDKLPSIFNAKTGAAQGERDYVLGHGRVECVRHFGYPQSRFMPAMVGVNPDRFSNAAPTDEELRQFGCDVSFVTHASASAEQLLTEQLRKADADTGRVLRDIYDRLAAIYDAGGAVTHPQRLAAIIDQSVAAFNRQATPGQSESLLDFFRLKVNSALFRHQSLRWLAEMDLDLRLYGRGWEDNAEFARYARGVADNQSQLCSIYRASRINLQAVPHGGVHQRLFEGVAAGGFFLIRGVPGDQVGRLIAPLYAWCQSAGICGDEDLRRRATPDVLAMISRLKSIIGQDPFSFGSPFVDDLELNADSGFTMSADVLFPEYADVAFHSREELQRKVVFYLNHPAARASVSAGMRRPILEQCTYRAISRRLLDFIAGDLEASRVKAAA